MKARRRHRLADWRSVRMWEVDTRHHLRRRHALWLHGWCMGALVLGTMWAASHAQMLLVEIAFGYVSARTAVRVAREGWVDTAVKLTWKPLLGALACAVLLGGLIDHFVPQARSLPHAVKLLRAV